MPAKSKSKMQNANAKVKVKADSGRRADEGARSRRRKKNINLTDCTLVDGGGYMLQKGMCNQPATVTAVHWHDTFSLRSVSKREA